MRRLLFVARAVLPVVVVLDDVRPVLRPKSARAERSSLTIDRGIASLLLTRTCGPTPRRTAATGGPPVPRHSPRRVGVGGVAEAVAEKVEAEDRRHDEDHRR